MSWENREYAQSGPWRDSPRFGGVALPQGATRWLIVVHVLTFIILAFFRPQLSAIADYISGMGSYVPPRPLTVLLHPFTPAPQRLLGGVFLTLFVCFVIGALGRMAEERLGAARMLTLYLLGNTLAGFAYLLAVVFAPAFARAPLDHPVGALAAWSLWAWRHLKFEYAPVMGRMRPIARIVTVAAGIVAVLEVFSHGGGALLWVAAAAVGSTAVFVLPLLERAGRRFARGSGATRPSKRITVPSRSDLRTIVRPSEGGSEEIGVDVDAILAKISREGMASLTAVERQQLERARLARLGAEEADQPR